MDILSKIVITRKPEWYNRLKKYRVFVNGQEIGSVKNADSSEFETVSGPHEIECKVNWCYSNKYIVDIKDGETVFLHVSSGMKLFWPVYVLMLLAIVARWVPSLNAIQNIRYVQEVIVAIAFLYFGYYISIGRRKYLDLQPDASNPFAQG